MHICRYSKSLARLAASLVLLSMLVNPARVAALAAAHSSVVSSGLQVTGASLAHTPDSLADCPSSIGFGETIQCSISAAGEIDTYTFSASAGDMVLVRMGKSSGSFWPGIRVFNSVGTKLCEANSSDSTTAEITGCALLSTGTYTIQAYDGLYGVSTGNYYLYLQRLNNPGSPVSINFGQTLSGSIVIPAEMGTFTFTGNKDDKVLVRVVESSSTHWPGTRVYSPDGTKLCEANSADSVSTEIASCTLTMSGIHTILAYGSSSGMIIGDYYIYLQRLNNPGSPVAIDFGQTLPGSIPTPAEMDTYTFSGNAGDKVLVRAGETSDTHWPGVRLYGPDGTKLCEANSTDSVTTEIASCTLTNTGIHTILAYGSSYGGSIGNYYITLQRLNNPGSSASIIFGQTLPGSIPTPARMEFYTFSGNAGDRVLVRMGESSGTLWPGLRVYGPDGTKLCQADSSDSVTTEITSCTLTNTGTHTILAYGSYGYGSFSGNYYIYLQRLNNPGSPVTINFGQTLPGSIPTPAEMDTFTFSGYAGDIVSVMMAETSGTLWPGIRVYAPDGTKLCQKDSTDSASAEITSCTLPITGDYAILAYGSYGYGPFIGNYSLTLNKIYWVYLPLVIR